MRVAPGELSYTSETAWTGIYGHRVSGGVEKGSKGVEMPKDPIFRLHTPTGAQNILVADRDTHGRQRRLLSHAFSEAALREQEPILQMYAGKMLEALEGRFCSPEPALAFGKTAPGSGYASASASASAPDSASAGASAPPVDIVSWLTFASFDLIGHMCFGENFGCLDSGVHAPFVRAISAMASELTFNQMCRYWGVMGLRSLFTPKKALGQRQKHIGTAMRTVAKRVERGGSSEQHRDFLHYVLRANDEKGMSPQEIHVNAFSLSIAGSESTATALSGAVFLVLKHPSVYERAVREVHAAHQSVEDVTLASTLKLAYLDAVITETLRLYPPVAITMPRRVPVSAAAGETVAGAFVPAGTTVGVNHYSAYRHPDNFHRANEFLPERWLPEHLQEKRSSSSSASPFAADNRDVMQPFSFGPRNCLGKNIARAEMRLLLAKLLYRFDWELLPGQEDWMEGQRVQGFWQKGPLWCRIKVAGK